MRKILLIIILFIISLNSSFYFSGLCQKSESDMSFPNLTRESSHNNDDEYNLDSRFRGNDTTKFYLDYQNLVQLSKTSNPSRELKEKLEKQLNTPIILQPSVGEITFLNEGMLGDFFRVASWNIERGFNIDLIKKVFLVNITSDENNDTLQEELRVLRETSIIILNEVDIGLPRTKYQNIVKELASVLKMGFIFGTEFIEVDPYQLGIEKFTNEERTFLEPQALEQLDNIDKNRFKGLHGTAVLSKYPILNAKIVRLPDCYKWYEEESNKLSALELARREAAEKVFSSKVLTELRQGGRMAIVADLLLPNNNKITVVATHLENRCVPECRYKQLEFLLNRLRNVNNPLVLAGDFNTTGADATPVSVKKEVLKRVKDPVYVAKQAILYLTPISLIQALGLNTANAFKQFKDPTTKNIPIILPNKERKLFDLLTEFRFNDGGAFDLRGISGKAYGYSAFSGNSNERSFKGYKHTFELERNLGIAKYKLDWFFVKPLKLKDPKDKEGSYVFAPHFGRTLQLVNRAFGNRISDHDPIVVDIPVREPLR